MNIETLEAMNFFDGKIYNEEEYMEEVEINGIEFGVEPRHGQKRDSCGERDYVVYQFYLGEYQILGSFYTSTMKDALKRLYDFEKTGMLFGAKVEPTWAHQYSIYFGDEKKFQIEYQLQKQR